MKALITWQFSYCTLVWMFHSKRPGRINAFHERALRTAYGDKTYSFRELLEKDNSVSIHQKNLQALAMNMCKISFKIYFKIYIIKNIFTPITCVTQLILTLQCLVVTKRSRILKQTCNWTLSVQLQVSLSMCDLFVTTGY